MAQLTRHELGQWFTPGPVADLALGLVLSEAGTETTLLDPSRGDGIFLQRALLRGVCARNLYGVDIDARAIAAARARVPAAHLACCDFFNTIGESVFDVVVGNPPYIRQERLQTSAKVMMVNHLASHWPQLSSAKLTELIGRSDLAAPFILGALRQLKPGGRAAFVVSSAFLDSGYGERFWKLLSGIATVEMIVDAPNERWFQTAAVNTMIIVLRAAPSGKNLCVARLHCSTEKSAQVIADGGAICDVADLRYLSQSAPKTWSAGVRAPDAWYGFLDAAGPALTTLGQIAEIRRGITSGANDVFYLRRGQTRKIPERFLAPVMRSPGKGGHFSIEFDSKKSSYLALVVDSTITIEEHADLAAYFADFPDASERKTLAAREPWWSLPGKPARVFLSKAYAARFVQPYCSDPVLADQRVYCVYPHVDINPEVLAAILNATTTALALECLGRASMGQGALEWTVSDARALPIIDPRLIPGASDVCSAFAELRRRAIGCVNSERDRSDRRALDRSLLRSWPALWAMRDGMYLALVEACAGRLSRARLR